MYQLLLNPSNSYGYISCSINFMYVKLYKLEPFSVNFCHHMPTFDWPRRPLILVKTNHQPTQPPPLFYQLFRQQNKCYITMSILKLLSLSWLLFVDELLALRESLKITKTKHDQYCFEIFVEVKVSISIANCNCYQILAICAIKLPN